MQAEKKLGSCTASVEDPPRTSVDLQVSAMEMMVHWGRCSLTANFLAGYVAPTFLDSESARVEISIMLDELIENAVKFCADVEEPVSVTVDNFDDAIRLRVCNLCTEPHARQLEQCMRRVLHGNPEDLFVEQVESAAVHDVLVSQLGFITLSMNQGVRLGARIVRSGGPSSGDGPAEMYEVTVQVMIQRDELDPLLNGDAAQC